MCILMHIKSGSSCRVLAYYALTIEPKTGHTRRKHLLCVEESSWPTKNSRRCAQSHTLHPHPEQVRDPLFTSGSPFFDPRDLVQVKYELLRRVRVEGDSVSQATALFGLSRPTFYTAQAAWERAGLLGLLPEPTGPRQAHKLTQEIVALLLPLPPRCRRLNWPTGSARNSTCGSSSQH